MRLRLGLGSGFGMTWLIMSDKVLTQMVRCVRVCDNYSDAFFSPPLALCRSDQKAHTLFDVLKEKSTLKKNMIWKRKIFDMLPVIFAEYL